MRIFASCLRSEIAFGLVMILAVPIAQATASPQQSISGQAPQNLPAGQNQSGGSVSQVESVAPETSRSEATLPESPAPTQPQTADQSGQPSAAQSASEQQLEATPKPVGAAAAPFERTTGVAASRPAGAVIAPAKQRRARSILIRVSIVVGGAVAIGTVVALSHGSPSRP
jgi:FtsZ-interacting cell division protein ZipA